ncbi:Retrovirus-related Pol polyprotein, partial [Mucuna pruriens]
MPIPIRSGLLCCGDLGQALHYSHVAALGHKPFSSSFCQGVLLTWTLLVSYIDYRKLNSTTHKDHLPLPFIDQVLEKLVGKSHYCFLDGYSRYMQIHIALEDQHKTTFTCPFGTFAYTRLSFALYNASSTFQRCMLNIFLDFLEECMEVFMDDFTGYSNIFDALEGLKSTKQRSTSLHISPTLLQYEMPFVRNFSKIALPLSRLLQKDVDFVFDEACIKAFEELKTRLTSTPILQELNWELPFELMCVPPTRHSEPS